MDELHQDAAGAPRMYERHAVAVSTRAGSTVDQLEPATGQVGELRLDAVDAVGNVVQSGASFLEEPPHGAVRREWLEQLQPGVPGADEADRHSLGFYGLDRGSGPARHAFECGEHRVDGLDCNRHVVEG